MKAIAQSRSRQMNRLTYPDIARILGTGLISTGVGLLLFVVITVVWGDPFTRLSERGEQQALERAFKTSAPTVGELRAAKLDPELTKRAAARAKRTVPLGSSAGRISIPEIGLRKIFVHGARDKQGDLQKGPGLYKETGFPGSGKPFAIAGHRTTYGAPFLNVDKLKPGHKIVLTVPYGEFTYTVTRSQVILPSDWTILEYGAAERTKAARRAVLANKQCNTTCEHLVLTACHPKYSAAKRLAVFARLTSVKLTASAGATAA